MPSIERLWEEKGLTYILVDLFCLLCFEYIEGSEEGSREMRSTRRYYGNSERDGVGSDKGSGRVDIERRWDVFVHAVYIWKHIRNLPHVLERW